MIMTLAPPIVATQLRGAIMNRSAAMMTTSALPIAATHYQAAYMAPSPVLKAKSASMEFASHLPVVAMECATGERTATAVPETV